MEITLPPNSSMRVFKYYDPATQTMHKVKKTIARQSDLKKTRDWARYDWYYSISTFLNAERIRSKTNEARIIQSLLVFDVDDTSITRAKSTAKLIHRFMKIEYKDYKLQYIAFSGAKGFHLVYTRPPTNVNLPQLEYREAIEQQSRDISNRLNQFAIDWDVKVTLNSWGVIRVPGTINQKSGRYCTIITPDMLNLSTDRLMKCIPYYQSEMQLAETKGIVGKAIADDEKSPVASNPKSARADLRADFIFVSNEVPGVQDRYCVFLKWEKRSINVLRIKSTCKKLSIIYKLNARWFIFETAKKYYAATAVALPLERVKKIVKASNSAQKTARAFIPIDMHYLDTEYVANKERVPNQYSASHMRLFLILREGSISKSQIEDLFYMMGDQRLSIATKKG